jgi:hypothetical protein
VKPGTRFWDPTQAGLILRKQLTILDEIEHALETAASAMKSGNNPMDYWNRWPAEQGTQIRERVARTRQIYLELQSQLASAEVKPR